MARGITIPFTLDVRQWRSAMRTVELDLDELARDLDDVERAGDDVETNLTRAFRNVGTAADRSMRDTETTIRSGSFRGAAGALAAEAGSEFVESWGEAVREGNPAGVVRELLSNAALIGAAAGGPIGAVAGLAASAFGTAFIDRMVKVREQIKAATSSLFGDVDEANLAGRAAGEAFARGYVEAVEIPGRVQQALGLDDAVAAAAKVSELAQRTGLDYGTVQLAIIGNADALREVQAAIEANETAYAGVYRRARDTNREGAEGKRWIDEQTDGLDEQIGALRDVSRIGGGIAATNRTNRDLMREATTAASRLAIETGNAAQAARGVRDVMREVRSSYTLTADEAERIKGALDDIPRSIPVEVIVTETKRDSAMARRYSGQDPP